MNMENMNINKLEARKSFFEKEYPGHNFDWKLSPDETRFSGKCPEHDDQNPSFNIYLDEKTSKVYMKCHGCGFDFYDKFKSKLSGGNPLYRYLFELGEACQNELYRRAKHEPNDPVIKYLKKRKIDPLFAAVNGFGIVPYQTFPDILKEISDDDYKKLIKLKPYGGQLTFAYTNHNGTVKGIKVRRNVYDESILREDKKIHWSNFFHDDEPKLFGTEQSPARFTYLVEGEFDALATLQFCYQNQQKINIYSVSGTGGFKSANNYFERQGYKIINVPDRDVFANEKKLRSFIASISVNSYVVKIPHGINDPDELFSSESLMASQKADFFSSSPVPAKKLKDAQAKADEAEKAKDLELIPAQVKFLLAPEKDSMPTSLTPSHCFVTRPQPLKFIFKGFMAGTVGIFGGPGGSGKSHIGEQLVISYCDTSEKINFGGLFNNQRGRAGYFSNEDPAAVLHHRLHKLGLYYGINDMPNLSVVTAAGIDFKLVSKNSSGYVVNQKVKDYLLSFCDKKDFVIIDTLRRLHSLKENDDGDMAEILGQIENIAAQTGAAILILAHVRKAGTDDGNGKDAIRGSSVLTDNTRFTGLLQRPKKKEDGGGDLILSFEKVNYTASPDSVLLKWRKYETEDGYKYSILTSQTKITIEED